MSTRSPRFPALLILLPAAAEPRLGDPDWIAEGTQANASFALGVSGGGDVNGDGFDDLLVAASGFDVAGADEGLVLLYLGATDCPSRQPDWQLTGEQADSHFGGGVAIVGDVNGDGFDDVLIGAGRFRGAGVGAGRVHLYLGSPDGPPKTPDWVAEGDSDSAHFGTIVARAGDVNGDGFDDVLIGAAGSDVALGNEGRAFLYLGSAEGLGPEPAWSAAGTTRGAGLGSALAGVGDVNGDGFDDVVVGAPGAPDPDRREGRAFVYLGSSSGLAATAASTLKGDRIGAAFGRRVAAAGDVDGDGFDDVLVAAPGFDEAFDEPGAAFLFRGSAEWLSTEPAWTVLGSASQRGFGYSITGAGDLDGDGYDDVAIGAPLDSHSQPQSGTVSIYRGSPRGLADSASLTLELDQTRAHFGATVTAAGDVNGDDAHDLLVGTPSYDGALTDAGAALLYLGPLADSDR